MLYSSARVRTDLEKVLNFDLGPRKLLDFEKSAFCPVIVMEFRKIVLENMNLSLKNIKYIEPFRSMGCGKKC